MAWEKRAQLTVMTLTSTVLILMTESSNASVLLAEKAAAPSQILECLTQRQKQVAQLVVKGRSHREIADGLGISIATVKAHVHAILDRLNLSCRVALTAAVLESG